MIILYVHHQESGRCIVSHKVIMFDPLAGYFVGYNYWEERRHENSAPSSHTRSLQNTTGRTFHLLFSSKLFSLIHIVQTAWKLLNILKYTQYFDANWVVLQWWHSGNHPWFVAFVLQGKNLQGLKFNLTMYWNLMPKTGALLTDKVVISGFQLPEQYS